MGQKQMDAVGVRWGLPPPSIFLQVLYVIFLGIGNPLPPSSCWPPLLMNWVKQVESMLLFTKPSSSFMKLVRVMKFWIHQLQLLKEVSPLWLCVLLKEVWELHKIIVSIEDCTKAQRSFPVTKASTMSFLSTTLGPQLYFEWESARDWLLNYSSQCSVAYKVIFQQHMYDPHHF